MRMPRGIKTEFDRVEGGKAHFKIRASRFYLFRVILKIAWQNIREPVPAFLIFLFAFYHLMRNGCNGVQKPS